MNRKAKIIATIGPASEQESTLQRLIDAGLNVARLNFSHGTHEEHGTRIERIRNAARKADTSVGILQDLQGPKIRIGELAAPMQLAENQTVSLYATGGQQPDGPDPTIPVDFRQLFDAVPQVLPSGEPRRIHDFHCFAQE